MNLSLKNIDEEMSNLLDEEFNRQKNGIEAF